MTETTGSIINIVNTGQVITLTVKYIVDHHVYSFKEEAVLKPARQLLLFKSKRKVPVLGTLRVGQEVTVYYDEKQPSTAYLKDNAR